MTRRQLCKHLPVSTTPATLLASTWWPLKPSLRFSCLFFFVGGPLFSETCSLTVFLQHHLELYNVSETVCVRDIQGIYLWNKATHLSSDSMIQGFILFQFGSWTFFLTAPWRKKNFHFTTETFAYLYNKWGTKIHQKRQSSALETHPALVRVKPNIHTLLYH